MNQILAWDKQLFLSINNFARATPWAHAFMAAFALWGGLVLIAAILLLTGVAARSCRFHLRQRSSLMTQWGLFFCPVQPMVTIAS